MSSRRRAPLTWKAQLTVGLTAVAAYHFLPSQLSHEIGYAVVGLFSVASVVLGLRRHRPEAALAWWLLAAGITSIVVADTIYYWLEGRVSPGGEAPFPSVADGFYLAFFPLVAAGLVAVLRRRSPGGDRAGLLDAALVTVAAGVLSWVFLMAPYAHDRGLSVVEKLVSIAYPLGDLMLLALVARLLLSPGRRVPASVLLTGAVVTVLAADVGYGVESLAGTYSSGSWLDTLYLATYVLWGTAALHPSMGELTRRAEAVRPARPRGRLAAMALASVAAPLLIIVRVEQRNPRDVLLLAVACLVMFLLVLVRMSGLVTDVEAQRDQLGRALGKLEVAQADRRLLLDRTVRAAEQERGRIAADLHDGPIQRLAGIALLLDRALLRLGSRDVATAEQLLERGADELGAEVGALRDLMAGLRPPVLDEAGLLAGVRELAGETARRSALEVRLEGEPELRLPAETETVLYRVLQETLTNVVRHADATCVEVSVQQAGEAVELRVVDDGTGFTLPPDRDLLRSGHYGLVGMRERLEASGGSLTLRTAPGAGTALVARLPVVAAAGAVPAGSVPAPRVAPAPVSA